MFEKIKNTDDLWNEYLEARSEKLAPDTHFKVRKTIRKAINDLGGTMPEYLEVPSKSIKEIEKRKEER